MQSIKEFFSGLNSAEWTGIALTWGVRMLVALLILLIGWWLARRIANSMRKVLDRSGADPLLGEFLRNLLFVLLMGVVIVGSLDRVGVPTASFLAVLGAAGLAIGLALQGSLSHLAAGVLLMIFRPFRVGQYVEVAGFSGKVESVSLMHTRLRTLDNREVILPNGKVAGDAILNFNAHATRRIDLVIGIGYGDDIGKAIEVVKGVLAKEPRVLADPEPTIVVSELADSSVNLAIRPWSSTDDFWDTKTSLLRAIKEQFDANGISIPFPQSEMTVRQIPAPAKDTETKSG